MALWHEAKSAFNIAEDVQEPRTDICGARAKFKNLTSGDALLLDVNGWSDYERVRYLLQ
jgi:hypothetical protein